MEFEHSVWGMVFREYSIDEFGRYVPETFINETLIYRIGSRKPLILELA